MLFPDPAVPSHNVILIRRRAGHTAAYGFLGVLLWESQEQESAYRARRAIRHWWESVTDGPTRIHRPAKPSRASRSGALAGSQSTLCDLGGAVTGSGLSA